MSACQSLLELALHYASAGLPVFPCGSHKRPLIEGGLTKATTDPTQVATWWRDHPEALIGLPTGEASGLFVLDLDIAKADNPDGRETLAGLGLWSVLDDAILAQTQSGGVHAYYRFSDGYRNTAGDRGRGIGKGIDTRGEGGYVIAPGSPGYAFTGGGTIELLRHARPIPTPLKARLDEKIAERERPAAQTPETSNVVTLMFQNYDLGPPDFPATNSSAWAEKALSSELEELRQATEGGRNHALNKAAFALGQIVAGGALERARVFEELASAALSIGLTPPETDKTIASGLAGGAREPRSVPEVGAQNVTSQATTPNWFASGRANELRARMLLGSQIAVNLNRRYVVKGWLYADTLGVTYGAPGSSKSFFILDLLRHVAKGENWRGNRVRQAPVLYIAGEGATGVLNRIAAAGGVPDNFAFLPALVDLCSNEIDARALLEAFRAARPGVGDPGIIVIDTLARAMAGGDENSGQDMGRLIRHADLLRELTGAHVHLVHHSGKDGSKGARGHSSLLGALDTEILVERVTDEVRRASITKQKDGEDGLIAAYQLESVWLGFDADDEAVTSCIVVPCELPVAIDAPKLGSAEQHFALGVLKQLIADRGQPNPSGTGYPEPGKVVVVAVEEFRRVLESKDAEADGTKRKRRSNDMVKKLTKHGIAKQNQGYIWVASS